MDKDTLLAGLDFSRMRLLGILETIEKSGQNLGKALAWRPGPGRAHIAWQAMHCAATHDRYLNVGMLQRSVKDEALVANFAGGTTPSDTDVPTLAVIRQKLSATFEPLKKFVSEQSPQSLARQIPAPGGKTRSVAEAIMLLAWHEAHHQGQIHLTWNLYKAAHGVA
ncbi:MAG: DinB family protein [Tepidisphaeraceae bacterium]